MILVDIYGKIDPTIISEKLGIGICNPTQEWVVGLQEDFDEEYLVHKHHIKTFERSGLDTKCFEGRYNYDNIVKKLKWEETNKNCKQIIAEHLIEIQVMDFDNSLLQKKNSHLDSPTCEMQYAKKYMNYCHHLSSSIISVKQRGHNIPCVTYDSDVFGRTPLIINYLEAHVKDKTTDIKNDLKTSISSLQEIGNKIDHFIQSENDFLLFDYIVDALTDVKQDNDAYHVFKVMSLIEMLIINPKNNGKTQGEIEKKLPQFLSDTIIDSSQKQSYATLMRKFRNKIGHGDFETVSKLLEEYRDKYMKNFQYDEFEYSIDNWTYGNISLIIDDALNNILWFMINDKSAWDTLRNNS